MIRMADVLGFCLRIGRKSRSESEIGVYHLTRALLYLIICVVGVL